MTNAIHTVELAVDQHEGEEFAAWLNAQGHTATIGRSTGTYIDGVSTSSDPEANEIANDLWAAYCDA